MRIVPLAPYPLKRTFDSFEAAVEGGLRHPLQRQAQADTTKLTGATLLDACWTDTTFLIRFSNGLVLRVHVSGDTVVWDVAEPGPDLEESALERVGSPPVLCRWPAPAGDHVMDRSALVASRRGSVLKQLFANDFGLLVYCRNHSILWLGVACRTDLGQSFLTVTEGG